jgi:hypothetical protein
MFVTTGLALGSFYVLFVSVELDGKPRICILTLFIHIYS